MLKKGLYGEHYGKEYKLTVDMERNIKVIAEDTDTIDETYVDTYNTGVYTKIVQAHELTNCVDYRYYGIMDGEKIDVFQEKEDQYQVGTGSFEIGTKLNLPRIDRDAWLGWVSKDRVQLIEEKTPIDPKMLQIYSSNICYCC